MTLETMSGAQERLAAAGFRSDLVASGSFLLDAATGAQHNPSQLRAMEIVRFEGDSDPADEAVTVAVATREGIPVGTFTIPFGPDASAAEAEVLGRLHRVVISEEEAAVHDVHDHIVAVFSSRDSAEAAIEELHEIGLADEHLGVAIRRSDTAVFERDDEHDLLVGLGGGAGRGAVVGAVGGMVLFAVAVPGIGALGVGGIAALGVASGFGSAMLGGLWKVVEASEEFDAHEQLRHTRIEPGEVLVVACGHGHPEAVERALQRHAGRLLGRDQ